jgi:hypothetical protein
MTRRSRTSTTRLHNGARWHNPTQREIAIWAGALVAAGAVGYGGYRLARAAKHPRPKPLDLPPPHGQGGPRPVACEIGPSYPGFSVDPSGICVPTDLTPPGIYVDATCSDFVFIGGDEGPQPERLSDMVVTLAQMTKNPQSRSADPTHNITMFLQEFWPSCTWPPPPTATSRILQMFNALSFLLGHEIVKAGGRVLGTGSLEDVDEQVAERLAQLGMPPFDQAIVPELELPVVEESPQPEGQPPGPGPDVQEPKPKPGTVDLPPGGTPIPSQQPDEPFDPFAVPAVDLYLKPCQKFPYTRNHGDIDLEPARWTGQSSHDFLLFDFDAEDNASCGIFNLRFGLCIRPTGNEIYGDLNPSAVAGVHLRNEDYAPVDYSGFGQPALWKRQYKTRVGFKDGDLLAEAPLPINDPGVDPCPDDAFMWPSASNGKFVLDVTALGPISSMQEIWRPRPQVSLVTKGRKVYARVFYTGMPQFRLGVEDATWGGIEVPEEWRGHYLAARFQTTPMRADYKVWALGAV